MSDRFQAAAASPWKSTGEPQVVSGRRLSEIMQRWRRLYVANRPLDVGSDGNVFGRRASVTQRFMGPTQWLTHETGLSERQIQKYMHGQQKWVGLGKADLILQAIGTGERIGDDLQVRRNPVWSLEKWTAYMAERGCV